MIVELIVLLFLGALLITALGLMLVGPDQEDPGRDADQSSC